MSTTGSSPDKLIRWLKKLHIHNARPVEGPGLHQYMECRCGKRTVLLARGPGHQPVDWDWLSHQKDDLWRKPTAPPPKPSDAVQAKAQ